VYHSSRRTRPGPRGGKLYDVPGFRIVLHFLPPYCPDENKIERLWRDLHSEVTRNHTCRTMNELMDNVRAFLQERAVRPDLKVRKVAA